MIGRVRHSSKDNERQFEYANFSFWQALLWSVAGLCIVFLIQSAYIHAFAINIPYWDEWDGIFLVIKRYNSGEISWLNLFDQHLDHRIFVPRLIFLSLFKLFGEGNVVSYMLASALLEGLIVGVTIFVFSKMRFHWWSIVIACIILISPMQRDNILWGLQVVFYTLVLGIIVAIFIVALAENITWTVIGVVVICCLFSMLSMVSGIFSWLIVGLCLVIWRYIRIDSLKVFFVDRGFIAKLFVFTVVGLISIGLYFYKYTFFSAGHSNDIREIILWSLSALSYPAILPSASLVNIWLPFVLILFWLPILINVIFLVRYSYIVENKKRLVLVVGLCCFIVINVIITSYGRSSTVYIPSRYATVFLWSGIVAVISLSGLFSYSVFLPLNTRLLISGLLSVACATLVFIQIWRYSIGFELMRSLYIERSAYRQTVIAYVNNLAADRVLGEPVPHPRANLLSLLNDQDFLNTLPFSLRPLPQYVSGDAWTLGGMFLSVEKRDTAWGSWSGSDSRVGSFVSRPIKVETSTFSLSITGYPHGPDTMLKIESTSRPQEQILYTGFNPGESWSVWTIDMSQFTDKNIRILAVDNSKNSQGWLGFSIDEPITSIDLYMNMFLDNLIAVSGIIISLLIGVCIFLEIWFLGWNMAILLIYY